jgi:hypothetical protein
MDTDVGTDPRSDPNADTRAHHEQPHLGRTHALSHCNHDSCTNERPDGMAYHRGTYLSAANVLATKRQSYN